MRANLEDTLLAQVRTSKDSVQKKLFSEWLSSESVEEREAIYAKVNVLDNLMFTVINNIRGGKSLTND